MHSPIEERSANVSENEGGTDGPAHFGRYELLTQIASGGMARVYVARTRGVGKFERLCAVKVCHPHLQQTEEMFNMFLDEARIASGIMHANVVATLDVGTKPSLHLVMDYVRGGSLHDILQAADAKGCDIPIPIVMRIAYGIFSGLHAAHEHTGPGGKQLDVIHRDVSPHNVLLGIDGSVRVTDFGVAWARERLTETAAGTMKGKFGYKAPEILRAARTPDRRTDVFAAGVVLWEMLAMRRLYTGDAPGDVVGLILSGSRPPLDRFRKVPDALAAIVDRCLSPWASRASTASAVAQDLEEAGDMATPMEEGRYVQELLADRLSDIEAKVQLARSRADANDLREWSSPQNEPIAPSRQSPRAMPGQRLILGVVVAVVLLAAGLAAWRFAKWDVAEPMTADNDEARAIQRRTSPVVQPAEEAPGPNAQAHEESVVLEHPAEDVDDEATSLVVPNEPRREPRRVPRRRVRMTTESMNDHIPLSI